MAVRTSASAVQAILGGTEERSDWDSVTDLTPFILAASLIVDRVVVCAVNRGYPLSATVAEVVERWLSAHMYVMTDQNYSTESAGGASGSYQGQTGMYLEASKYGQMAMILDPSGCLKAISTGQRASLTWLGKLPRERTPYDGL